MKFIVLVALSAALAGCASSPLAQGPAAHVAPASATSPYAQPGLRQSQYECVTDEGYGRWQPCSSIH